MKKILLFLFLAAIAIIGLGRQCSAEEKENNSSFDIYEFTDSLNAHGWYKHYFSTDYIVSIDRTGGLHYMVYNDLDANYINEIVTMDEETYMYLEETLHQNIEHTFYMFYKDGESILIAEESIDLFLDYALDELKD